VGIVENIVSKFIMQLDAQLSERGITLSVSNDAIRHLAVTGYDVEMGARPIGRLIQEKIKKPLANEILFGDLVNGGSIIIDLKTDEPALNIIIQPLEKKKSTRKNKTAA
jgi:ATP-dependent Clp protease ATP-binding subunit ClpA